MASEKKIISDDLIIYSVILSRHEELDFKNDALAGVRANYFNSGKKTQKDKTEVMIGNRLYNLSYSLSDNKSLLWKITGKKRILQTVRRFNDGVYCVITFNENGVVFKRQYFNSEHMWLKTEYYHSYISDKLISLVYPRKILGVLMLVTESINTEGNSEVSYLYPSKKAPKKQCTALVYTNDGMIWFDESLKPENTDAPALKVKELPGFSYRQSQKADLDNTVKIDFNSAEYLSESLVTDEKSPAEDEINEDFSGTYSAYEKIERILTEAKKTNKDLFGEVVSQTAENNLLKDNTCVADEYEIEKSEEFDPFARIKELEKELDRIKSKDASLVGVSDNDLKTVGESTEETEPLPMKDGNTEEPVEACSACDISDKTGYVSEKNQFVSESSEESLSNFEEISADADSSFDSDFVKQKAQRCDVIINTKSGKYSYYGEVDENNCRIGRGITVAPDGTISYDGEYINDKRDGFGVCYYKEGKINYVGNWSKGSRNGCGVGYRLSDGTMHAGRWNDNKPEGFGARFDKNGDFLDLCKYKEGVREGVSISFNENGDIVISKWKDGEKLSSVIVSDEV